MTYVQHIQRLAQEDPQAFICHYYNFYFAHTAGGRMIGSKVNPKHMSADVSAMHLSVINALQHDTDKNA